MKLKEFSKRSDLKLLKKKRVVDNIKATTSKEGAKKRHLLKASDIPKYRRSLIESEKSDPKGFERVIGESELLSVNFLTRGIKASKAVCRIRVPDRQGEWFGSGFLVGPKLLLTNHHVIASKKEASQCEVEFDYEHDVDGVLKIPVGYNLRPDEVFFTDSRLDITFVSISEVSNTGVPIDRYGYLQLLPISGKGIPGEWVTIVQHPNGLPKQMTIRANQIVKLAEGYSKDFIHYTTDTDPGSSGSPVLNDQWQVVAIHHRAIADPDSPEDSIEFIANEGIRISAIYNLLRHKRFTEIQASKVLDGLSRTLGMTPTITDSSRISTVDLTEAEGSPYRESQWEAVLGYDKDFLSQRIDLQTIINPIIDQVAALKNDESILDYMHFSSVIHETRKLPMITAVNIKGSELRHPGSISSSWRRDIRLDLDKQSGDNLYKRSVAEEPIYFSRGHLVRKMDPSWGSLEEARKAVRHTYHFTNAAPQFQRYNNVEWGDLEDYVLDRTQSSEKRVSVFTGPIFYEDDPFYGYTRENGPWQIPVLYWKIAVIQKEDDTISAAGFIVGQLEYLEPLYESTVFTGLNPYSYEELSTRRIQTPISVIGEETGLDFGALIEFDAVNALESSRQTQFIRRNEDIFI